MVIELYNCTGSPPCKAVIFTAKELGIDLKITDLNLLTGEHMKPEFTKINPQHCVPTIVDHSNGLVLWESRAILAYLVNKHAPGHSLYPADAKERALVDKALYFEAGSLYPAQAAAFYGQFFGKPIDEAQVKTYYGKLEILNKTLGDNKYVVGAKKTLADLSLMATLVAAEALGADLSPYSNVARWLKNLRSEIAYDDLNRELSEGLKAFLKK